LCYAAVLPLRVSLQISFPGDNQSPTPSIMFRAIKAERLLLAGFGVEIIQRVEFYFCVAQGVNLSAFQR
jgi:hypothetical protein